MEHSKSESGDGYYKIVWDSEQVKQFASIVLSRIENLNACIGLYLFSRRKYDSNLPQSQYILKRIYFSSGKTPDEFYRELLKLHVPFGSYSPKEISQQSLCVNTLLRPKDQLQPMLKVFGECIKSISLKQDQPRNLLQRYIEEIGKSDYNVPETEIVKWVQIDLDTKEVDFLTKFSLLLKETHIEEHIIFTVETKNGYHIVFEKSDECNLKLFHEEKMKTKFSKLDKNGKKVDDYAFNTTNEPNVIVPGTYQGGFKATFSQTWFKGRNQK